MRIATSDRVDRGACWLRSQTASGFRANVPREASCRKPRADTSRGFPFDPRLSSGDGGGLPSFPPPRFPRHSFWNQRSPADPYAAASSLLASYSNWRTCVTQVTRTGGYFQPGCVPILSFGEVSRAALGFFLILLSLGSLEIKLTGVCASTFARLESLAWKERHLGEQPFESRLSYLGSIQENLLWRNRPPGVVEEPPSFKFGKANSLLIENAKSDFNRNVLRLFRSNFPLRGRVFSTVRRAATWPNDRA